MKKDSVSLLQITLLLTTAVGLKNHVTVLPHLLSHAKRDAWISVIVAFFIMCILSLLFLYIHKATNNGNIFTWVENHVGQKTKQILVIVISLYFVLQAAFALKEMVAWTKASYLPIMPSVFQILLFVLLCFVLVSTNLQTMVIINTFVLSAVIVFGFFVAFVNIRFKDFTLLLPILEDGFEPVFAGLVYPLSGLIEIVTLLFIQHKIHGQIKYRWFIINAVILCWLVLGPLIGAIVEFGPTEAARQKYPAYEQWGLASLGRFIEHVDFLSIYQWITGSYIRVSYFLFLSLELFNFKSRKKRLQLLFLYSIIVVAINLLPLRDVHLYGFISKIMMPMTFIFFTTLSILFVFFVFIAKWKNRGNTNVQK